MGAYGFFAQFYDALTQNVDYKRRAGLLSLLIRQRLPDAKLLLDVACGTGSLAFALAELGYDVIGADASAQMLSVAVQKLHDCPHKVLFLQQAMDKLDLYGTVDVAVCTLDSVNHLAEESTVEKAFAKIALFLNPGGLFIFDVNTAYKHRKILADNAFVYDLPQVYCCWQNKYHTLRDRVDITLDFFVPAANGGYIRQSEAFSEWVYPDEILQSIFAKCGLTCLQMLDGDTFLPPTANSQRLCYVVAKRR